MQTSRRPVEVLVAAVLVVGAFVAAGATAPTASAATTDTPVRLSADEVHGLLFVAGDVARLSEVREGTIALVLEKVLQRLYEQTPGLAPATAEKAIGSLKDRAASRVPSEGSLLLRSSNERILSVLYALDASGPTGRAESALRAVVAEAMDELGRTGPADAERAVALSADQLATLTLPPLDAVEDRTIDDDGFAPSAVLERSVLLAEQDEAFGAARHLLWGTASGPRLHSTTTDELLEKPGLSSLRPFIHQGEMDTTVKDLRDLFREEVNAVNATGLGALKAITRADSAEPEPSEPPEVREETLARGEAAMTFGAQAVASVDENEGHLLAKVRDAAVASADLLHKLSESWSVLGEPHLNFAKRLSTLAAGGNLLSAGVALATIFLDTGPSPDELVREQVKALHDEVREFRSETEKRFDSVDYKLAQMAGTLDEIRAGNADIRAAIARIADFHARVDRLEVNLSEQIRALARADLLLATTEALGRREPLTPEEFRRKESVFFSYATTLATQATAVPPNAGRSFAPAAVFGELRKGGEPDHSTGEGDLLWKAEYLREFPAAPEGLGLSPLTSDTLPGPSDWRLAARAYEQLLAYNPAQVSEYEREHQLGWIMSYGQRIADTQRAISRADSATGTHSRLFNRLLNYYRKHLNTLDALVDTIETDYRAPGNLQGPGPGRLQQTPKEPERDPTDSAFQNTDLDIPLFGGLAPPLPASASQSPQLVRGTWPGMPKGPGGQAAWRTTDDDRAWAPACKGQGAFDQPFLPQPGTMAADNLHDAWSVPLHGSSFARWQAGVQGVVFTLPKNAVEAANKPDFFPREVRLARRLGAGNVEPCVYAHYIGSPTLQWEMVLPGSSSEKNPFYTGKKSQLVLRKKLRFEVRWFFTRADDPTTPTNESKSTPPADRRNIDEAIAWTVQDLPKDECVSTRLKPEERKRLEYERLHFQGCLWAQHTDRIPRAQAATPTLPDLDDSVFDLETESGREIRDKFSAEPHPWRPQKIFPALLNLWFTWDMPPANAQGKSAGGAPGFPPLGDCADEIGGPYIGTWFGSGSKYQTPASCPWNLHLKRTAFEKLAPPQSHAAGDSSSPMRNVETAAIAGLRSKQRGLYRRIYDALRTGRDPAFPGDTSILRDALLSLDGAKELLASYSEFGLSASMGKSFDLPTLLRGTDRPQADAGPLPASDDIISAYGQQARSSENTLDGSTVDVTDELFKFVADARLQALKTALTQAIDAGHDGLDQSSPLVRPTLQRLALTRSRTAPTLTVVGLATGPERRTVEVTVRCPRSAVRFCEGRIDLETVGNDGPVSLGTVTDFHIDQPDDGPGVVSVASVSIGPSGRKRLVPGSAHRVSVRAWTHDAEIPARKHWTVSVHRLNVPAG